jgi:hypothetical protein
VAELTAGLPPVDAVAIAASVRSDLDADVRLLG